jgi:uncharacterized protein DUF4412
MSWRVVRRAAVALLAAMATAAVTRAESFVSAHWKSKFEIEGNRQGPSSGEYEIWTKGGKMRMKGEMGKVTMNMLKISDDLYTWTDGQGQGMKINVAAAKQQNRPSHDYIHRIEEFKSKGKKVGSETLDGHPCDIYEYDAEKGNHGRYWLARDLRDFPIKAVVEQNGMKVTYHNVKIEAPAMVADSMMEIPKDVEFQDLSEMMKGMQRKER